MKPKTLTVNQKNQIYFTYLLLKRKKKSDLLYHVEKESKKPKDKQICNDLSASVEAYFLLLLRLACLLQLRLTLCCSCVLHCTYSRERERENWRKRWKEKSKKWGGYYCCLIVVLVPKCVDVISKCVAGGNLGYVESRMCGGEKISNGQWYCYSGCTYFLLFERLKNN